MTERDQQVMSNKKKFAGAFERIDKIEDAVTSITKTMTNEQQRLANELNNLSEILNAIISNLGEEVIGQALVAQRLQKLEAQAEQNRALVAEAVSNGKLQAGTVVTPASILVVKEFAKDSTVPNPPGVAYYNFVVLTDAMKELLLGKSVGAVVPTPAGGTLEVTALFEPAVVVAAVPPPVDNDHVAEGATPFTAAEIAANADVVAADAVAPEADAADAALLQELSDLGQTQAPAPESVQ
jgi:hypothetical protein